jgi:hypothetical protein
LRPENTPVIPDATPKKNSISGQEVFRTLLRPEQIKVYAFDMQALSKMS